MDLGLQGKVVVITGGSQGIGKAAARAFLEEGCKVAVCARRKERLEATKAEFLEEGYELYTEVVDVTRDEQLQAFADHVEDTYGRIDIWINNAGANHYEKILDYTREELMDIINTDFVSVFAGGQIAARKMMKSGGGVILNASSYAAITPFAGKAPYAAMKSGVISLTKCMAAEFACYHIRVNAYIPGTILTEINKPNMEKFGDALIRQIPLKRAGEPEDVAKTLVFLASDAAAYVNATTLEISGGKRCVQNPWYSYEE